MSSRSQFTDDQLQIALHKLGPLFGDSFVADKDEWPTDLDQPIVEYNDAVGGNGDTLYWFSSNVRMLFGCELDRDSLDDPTTMRGFATWALNHMLVGPMEPINIVGQISPAGGIFIGLKAIAGQVTCEEEADIGPSTRIKDYFENLSDLSRFWFHANFWSRSSRLPLLLSPVSGSDLGCLATIGGATATIVLIGLKEYAIALSVACGLIDPLRAVFRYDRRERERRLLPGDIETFGDLARAFAKQPPLEPTPA